MGRYKKINVINVLEVKKLYVRWVCPRCGRHNSDYFNSLPSKDECNLCEYRVMLFRADKKV